MQVSETPINKATIRAVAQLIAERFDPEQIILFGSHARGNAGSHSDIDLLVVLKSLDDWPKRDNPIRAAIAEHFILPRRRTRHHTRTPRPAARQSIFFCQHCPRIKADIV